MAIRMASCICGRLKVEVDGDPLRVNVCHCYDCQRRTGSVFGVQSRYRRDDINVTGESREYVRFGDEGTAFRHAFCPECGSTVLYYVDRTNSDETNDFVVIPVGGFADSDFPPPTLAVYEERRHSWVTLPEDIEIWD